MADTFHLTEAQLTQKRRRSPSPVQETEAEKRERQWKQLLDKISFTPASEDYYAKWPIRPGVYFFRALALAKQPIDQLKVNLPETIMGVEQSYVLFYTDPVTGRLQRKNDMGYQDFEQKIHEYNEEYLNRFSKNRSYDERTNVYKYEDGPYLIGRGQTGQDWNMTKAVVTFRQQKERKAQLDNNKLEQRFVVSRALKATILRLVYFTKNSKSTQANYGFRIMNNLEIYDPNQKKSITNKSCLNSEQPNSFTMQTVKGSGLREYEKVSEQLVLFLEKNYPVRIREAVFDFVQDLEGRVWIIGCKSLLMENAISMSEIQGVGQGKKTLDQLTCSVYCKLCGIIFKKDDASKTLTYKLLWELVQHLKKRNMKLTNIKVSHLSTRPCRVCDVCYMLIVGEHELVEIEQKFAMAQNIPLGDAIIRVPVDTKPKHRPALLSEQLYQWRLLFFFESVELRTSVVDLNGNQVPDLANLFVQYKLFQHKSSFNTTPQGDELKMNVIRVHYFFSESADIEKFLNETEIKMRLTTTEWVQYYAEGATKTIHHFKNHQLGGQRHSTQCLLFFVNGQYCILNFQVGLVCDGQYNTAKLNLYKHNNVYFPDDNYYNCNPFPPEWMEMFDPESVNKHNSFEEQTKEIEAYSPKCTKNELNQMIDFNKYKETNRFKDVPSRIQNKREIKSAAPFTQQQPQISLLPQVKKKTANSIRQIDEQFLLQQYMSEDQEAGDMLFKEKKKKQIYEQHNIVSEDDSDENEELNQKFKKQIQQRQTQSAQTKFRQFN